jgi:hypothetical protein
LTTGPLRVQRTGPGYGQRRGRRAPTDCSTEPPESARSNSLTSRLRALTSGGTVGTCSVLLGKSGLKPTELASASLSRPFYFCSSLGFSSSCPRDEVPLQMSHDSRGSRPRRNLAKASSSSLVMKVAVVAVTALETSPINPPLQVHSRLRVSRLTDHTYSQGGRRASLNVRANRDE